MPLRNGNHGIHLDIGDLAMMSKNESAIVLGIAILILAAVVFALLI